MKQQTKAQPKQSRPMTTQSVKKKPKRHTAEGWLRQRKSILRQTSK